MELKKGKEGKEERRFGTQEGRKRRKERKGKSLGLRKKGKEGRRVGTKEERKGRKKRKEFGTKKERKGKEGRKGRKERKE